MVIGDPHHQPALSFHQPRHSSLNVFHLLRSFPRKRESRANWHLIKSWVPAFAGTSGNKHYASSRLNATDALVPPKPNEFDNTQPSLALSRRSRTIGMSAKAGSRFSILALSQMNPLFIISSE